MKLKSKYIDTKVEEIQGDTRSFLNHLSLVALGSLLFLLLVYPFRSEAITFETPDNYSTEVGYLYGFHILNDDVNDSHPFATTGTDRFRLHYFHNSHKRASFALAGRFTLGEYTYLDLGMTSGYTRKNAPDNLWVGEYMLVVSIGADIPLDEAVSLKMAILGDAVNFGMSIKF